MLLGLQFFLGLMVKYYVQGMVGVGKGKGVQRLRGWVNDVLGLQLFLVFMVKYYVQGMVGKGVLRLPE